MNFNSYTTSSGKIDKDGDPDIVYYNVDIVSGPDTPKNIGDVNVLQFNDTRSTPIINNISKYYFSIIRFSMGGPNKNLPLAVLPIKLGQANINLTTLKIRIDARILYNSGSNLATLSSTKDVIYVSESLDAFTNGGIATPQAPTTSVDRLGTYYWLYSYDHFSKLINTTIQNCFDDIQTQLNAALPTPTTRPIITQPAKLVYNENSKLFDFYFDARGWSDLSSCNNSIGSATTSEIFTMSFNADLYNLLSNFDYKNIGIGGGATTLPYQFLISNKNYKNYYAPTTPLATNLNPQPSTSGYFVMTQNYESTSSLWSPISSIVFTSGTLPLVNELTAAPNYVGDNLGTQTTNSFQPIITDIALGMDNGASSYREFISYVPSGEYRLSSFTNSNQPLKQVDLQIYWKNRLDLELYPIALTAYSSASLKIMFKKKHLI
jgi:hypothetical protein